MKISNRFEIIDFSRPGCRAADQFDIKCPYYGPYARLRFGDHDRLPHPRNCNLFYACLRKGLPRLNTCPTPKVFNPKSGFCDEKKNVPGCEGGNISTGTEIVKITKDIRDKIRNEIREQLLQEFRLPAMSRVIRSGVSRPLPQKTVLVSYTFLTCCKGSKYFKVFIFCWFLAQEFSFDQSSR